MARRYFGQWRFLPVLIRTTLLQSAHPQIGAGVTDYSTFRPHLWRRFNNTTSSLLRLVYGDAADQEREVTRLERMHARISGVDDRGRPYSALDQGSQAWVILTMFDAVVTMCDLSGEPMPDPEQEQLYAEMLELARMFGVGDEHLPPTVADFRAYFAEMVSEHLEYTTAARTLVEEFIANMPRPEPLAAWQPVWNTVRSVATGPANMILRALLPAEFRSRFGLDVAWYAELVTGLLFRATALATKALPVRWTYQSYAAARLTGPSAAARASAFFTEVLDQTGNGFVTWPDLAAMARQISAQFDVDPDTEAELYAAFEGWWRQLAATADVTGDGRIELAEWLTVVGALAATPADGDELDRVIRAMFRAADIDKDGRLSAEEYVTLFGGRADRDRVLATLGELDADGNGLIAEGEFRAAIRAFVLGRRGSTLVSSVLAAT
ncbi:oxygenase MpaB family protein [Longispora urticae]